MNQIVWSVVLIGLGTTALWMAPRHAWGWLLNGFTEVLWFAYAVAVVHSIPLAVMAWIWAGVNARNYLIASERPGRPGASLIDSGTESGRPGDVPGKAVPASLPLKGGTGTCTEGQARDAFAELSSEYSSVPERPGISSNPFEHLPELLVECFHSTDCWHDLCEFCAPVDTGD